MDEPASRLPDLRTIIENLKDIDYLVRHDLLKKEIADAARKLHANVAILYFSALEHQFVTVQQEYNKGVAQINAKAEQAKKELEKSFMTSAKGDGHEDDSVRQ